MREREQAVRALLDRPGLRKVFSALAGDEVRVVGGAVRNALLGEPVADIDLAVAAVPQDVLGKAESAGLRVVPTGIDHGTLTLIVDGAHFEITSLREDVETDGRRAKVRFGGDFAADARRRDFTINALVGGRSRRSFTIMSAGSTISRRGACASSAIRNSASPRIICASCAFSAFPPATAKGRSIRDGLHACIARRAGIATLSRERLGGEMLKILASPRSCAVVETMSKAGLLAFLGVAPWPARCRRVSAILAARGDSDALLALAALALHSEADSERLAESLRLSRAQKRRLAGMAKVAAAWHGGVRPRRRPRNCASNCSVHGAQAARDGLILIQAESAARAGQPGFSRRRRLSARHAGAEAALRRDRSHRAGRSGRARASATR